MDYTSLSDKIRCNVWHDGSHYIACPKVESAKRPKDKPAQEFSPEKLYFDYVYVEAVRAGLRKKRRNDYCEARIREEFPDMKNVKDFVDEQCIRKSKNFEARMTRFKRKAYLNKWSYFLTVTWSPKKWENEQEFRAALKRTLANFAVRRGWRYTGVWERGSDSERLHFHCIVYIPRGEMVGKLEERREYNPKLHRMETRICNTFFEKRFGRSDIQTILPNQVNRRSVVNYILKYLSKSEDKIVYCRDLPCEVEKTIDGKDVATTIESFVLKFVLYDDVFETDSFASLLSSE